MWWQFRGKFQTQMNSIIYNIGPIWAGYFAKNLCFFNYFAGIYHFQGKLGRAPACYPGPLPIPLGGPLPIALAMAQAEALPIPLEWPLPRIKRALASHCSSPTSIKTRRERSTKKSSFRILSQLSRVVVKGKTRVCLLVTGRNGSIVGPKWGAT